MYCPKCGTENADGAAFCQGCGQALSTAAQGATPPQGAAAPQSGQPYYAGAPYQQAAPGTVPHIPSHLPWAIVSILLFWPTGIPATVYASRVDNLVMMGNIAGAQQASSSAKTFSIISTVAFVVWLIIVIIVVATTGSAIHYYG